ncbi:MAG: hypothetical protein FJX57_06120, partial [Alphaproteobacteria bacterium]|nr:hypothetical protein [Alphaproteobacteria bacterium]
LWGFNPFAWQLIFFTGYGLSIGWIRLSRLPAWVIGASAAYLLVGALISLPSVYGTFDPLAALREVVTTRAHKPNLDILQYLHFLASACVALALLEGRLEILTRAWAAPFVKVGQQALIVFVTGMALSHVGGMVMQTYGTGGEIQILVNVAGFGTLIGLAYAASWLKNPPWKSKATVVAKPVAPAPIAAPKADALHGTGLLATTRG